MEGRTYRYFRGEPEYPFGYGLSYTSFGYSSMKAITPEIGPSGTVVLEVTLKNTGTTGGEEVVQVYFRHTGEPGNKALRSLVAFKRVFIAAGESRTIEFKIPASRLQHYSEVSGRYELLPGEYLFYAGSNSADEAVKTDIAVLSVCEIGDLSP